MDTPGGSVTLVDARNPPEGGPGRHGRPNSWPIIGPPRLGVKLRWAKRKALLRGLQAGTLGALEAALATLVDAMNQRELERVVEKERAGAAAIRQDDRRLPGFLNVAT